MTTYETGKIKTGYTGYNLNDSNQKITNQEGDWRHASSKHSWSMLLTRDHMTVWELKKINKTNIKIETYLPTILQMTSCVLHTVKFQKSLWHFI